MIKENRFFKNVWCINDTLTDIDKTTRIWGETKGIATTTDRIVILSNINPFIKFKGRSEVEALNIRNIDKMTKTFIGA
jgi:site-specific DNA-methyltransferase (adenine-specific)